ncbi:MAG TPA: hypothetical protein VIK11_11655 [Tepidiformaceae bacterium]
MMNQPEEAVLFDVSDGVATITLNRPEQLNAINGALTKGLGGCVSPRSANVTTFALRSSRATTALASGTLTTTQGQIAIGPRGGDPPAQVIVMFSQGQAPLCFPKGTCGK